MSDPTVLDFPPTPVPDRMPRPGHQPDPLLCTCGRPRSEHT